MPNQISSLRHSIRGTINALKLGASAMGLEMEDVEAVEFLDYIVQAADKMCLLMDQWDEIPDSVIAANPPASPSIAGPDQ